MSTILISELPHVRSFNISAHTLTKEGAEKNPAGVLDSSVVMFIKPGANFLERAELDKFQLIRRHPDFLKLVDEGLMRVIEPKKTNAKVGKSTTKDEGPPESLEGIEGPMAVSLVKGTMEADILKKWQDEEDRETVKTAIRDQLKIVVDMDKARADAQAVA